MAVHAPLFLYLGLAALVTCTAPKVSIVTSPEPATLRIALGGVPATFDPALQRAPWERALASFYIEPLLRVAPDLSDVESAAASSYEVSPDGRTYTFHLRPDGRFWDGAPVTAADFVFAWKRLIDPRTASPHADLFASAVDGGAYAEALDPEDPAAPIDVALSKLGLAAPDPSTFVVTLAEPSAWFKWVATVWAGGPLEPGNLRTNGPFRVQGVKEGSVTLVPNASYRLKPRLAKVVAAESQASDPTAYDLALAAAGTAGAVRVPQPETEWIVLNTYRAPLGSLAVRRALAGAISTSANQLLPPGTPGRLPGPDGLQTYDPAAAAAELKSADVSVKSLSLLVEDTPSGRALGASVHDQLQRNLGIEVTIDAVSAAKYAERIGNRDFQLAGPQRWVGDYPDPQNWLDQFTTGNGSNSGRWQDPLFDDLVSLADASLDSAARSRTYAEAELELTAQAPVVFLDQPVAWVYVSHRLRGLVKSPQDPVPALGATGPEALYITG